MTYLKSTNSFFYNRYKNLGYLAIAPINWSLFGGDQTGEIGDAMLDFIDNVIKMVASPILLPATAVTASFALVFCIVTALLHGIAALGATILDCVSPQDKTPESTAILV